MSKRRGTNWPLIIGVLAVIGISITFGKKIQNIISKVYVKRVAAKDVKLTWTGLTGKILIEIQNNSNISVTLTGFVGKAYYGAYPLADLTIASPVTIATESSTIILVDVRTDYSQLPQTVSDIIQSGQYISALKIKGNLYGEGVSLPIDYTISLTP